MSKFERMVRRYDWLVAYNYANKVDHWGRTPFLDNDEYAVVIYGSNTGEAQEAAYEYFYDAICNSDGLSEDSAVAILPIFEANARQRIDSGVGLEPVALMKSLLRGVKFNGLKYCEVEFDDLR